MSLTEVSETGDARAQLVELRTILANAIDRCESDRDLAALSRRYMAVIDAIDVLDRGIDGNDEIAAIILRNRKPASD